MLMLISPTKNLKPLVSDHPLSIPMFASESKKILDELKDKNIDQLMDVLCVKENVASLNMQRYREIDYDDMGTAAFLTYSGIQFKYMNHRDLNDEDIYYANDHLRILSGFYGIVRPLDSIYPYRLEMQAKLPIKNTMDLYAYWKDHIMQKIREELLTHEKPIILDLCSQEYTKAFYPYLKDTDCYVRITFRIYKNGKLKTEATQAKMARGRMVHDIIKYRLETLDDVKTFHSDGYRYHEELSSESELVFIKESS